MIMRQKLLMKRSVMSCNPQNAEDIAFHVQTVADIKLWHVMVRNELACKFESLQTFTAETGNQTKQCRGLCQWTDHSSRCVKFGAAGVDCALRTPCPFERQLGGISAASEIKLLCVQIFI